MRPGLPVRSPAALIAPMHGQGHPLPHFLDLDGFVPNNFFQDVARLVVIAAWDFEIDGPTGLRPDAMRRPAANGHLLQRKQGWEVGFSNADKE